MPQMTTAEAIVEGLTSHGLDTIYALPGVQNDHLFDALFKAQDRVCTIHTRHEQGAAYMALGAALATDRPGPPALECAINVWGKPGDVTLCDPLTVEQPAIDEDALRDAAKRLAAAKNPLIVAGGGAQDASREVTTLAELLQAPVLC